MKLLFINGSRGEWGYIKPIIDLCINKHIDYSICATNMLMLPSHGNLYEEIVSQGYKVSEKIYMSLEGHNHTTMTKSLGLFMISFVDVISREKPTWIICAGDRGEQLVATMTGCYCYVPVAHIQAGERSGNIDGTARHAIAKLAHIHFASNEDAQERLLKSGEQDFRVFNVGAPQLDEMIKENIPEIDVTFEKLSVPKKKYLLCIYHPVTEEMKKAHEHMKNFLKAVNEFDYIKIWILPNNDAGSSQIRNALFNNRDSKSYIFDNLDRQDYLSILKNSLAILGNSSSALLEAPTYSIPALNIGRRQNNRLQGNNVMNCDNSYLSIKDGIKKIISKSFKNKIFGTSNPYGDGKSSERIIEVLSSIKIDSKLLIKDIAY